MLKELSFEEVLKFYDELGNDQMGKLKKVELYASARAYEEIKEKENAVVQVLHKGNRDRVQNVTLIGDDMAVVEIARRYNGEDEITFYPIVKGKRISEVSDNFDYAVILALSNKYGEGSNAPHMIYNMLRMDKLVDNSTDK